MHLVKKILIMNRINDCQVKMKMLNFLIKQEAILDKKFIKVEPKIVLLRERKI